MVFRVFKGEGGYLENWQFSIAEKVRDFARVVVVNMGKSPDKIQEIHLQDIVISPIKGDSNSSVCV